MNILNKLFNWLLGIKEEEILNNEYNGENPNEDINNSTEEIEEWIQLQDLKQQAIKKCKGCRDKVFVLKKDGEDIAYAANIRQLSIVSNLPSKSLYRAYNDKRMYKKIYEITKLE